jgi:hypothetical protein
MGGKGGTTIEVPEQVDASKAMGEYLFGADFGEFEGVTDPRLQQRIIAAERAGRPEFTALELADIGTMARGLEARANPERQRLQAQLAGLEAARDLAPETTPEQLEARLREIGEQQVEASGLFDSSYSGRGSAAANAEQNRNRQAWIDNYVQEQTALIDLSSSGEERARQIAQLEAQIGEMPEQLEATPGLFDLLEEQSRRAGDLQREQLGLQRAEDVSALQEFAPQVVEAYRGADPYSTRLAELAQAQAERAYGRAAAPITEEERREVEQSVLARSGIDPIAQADRSAVEMALGRRGLRQQQEQFAAGLGQGAFAQQRALAGDLGATILGRPSSAINLGGQLLGQAQTGAAGQMGPQLYDPNAGVNLAAAQRADTIGLLGAQAQADAARSAGASSALGSIVGGAMMLCWVAREVYGEKNPKWIQFRSWLLVDSPAWFRNLYIRHGERFAKFISNKPKLKHIVRFWMNTKIK